MIHVYLTSARCLFTTYFSLTILKFDFVFFMDSSFLFAFDSFIRYYHFGIVRNRRVVEVFCGRTTPTAMKFVPHVFLLQAGFQMWNIKKAIFEIEFHSILLHSGFRLFCNKKICMQAPRY